MRHPGWIYFLQAETGGPIKIGWSSWPERRLSYFQSFYPFSVRFLGLRLGNRVDERCLHLSLAAHRIRGEWFEDCAAVRGEIERSHEDVLA